MSQPLYDPSSKWMLEEHGASVLRLAGARDVVSCRARKAEVVQPRKLPDGLLAARFAGQDEDRLVLVESATYPEQSVVTQIRDDIRLVRQARGVLPDAVVLCLCPNGEYRVPESAEDVGALGWTREALRWKVVEMWRLSAEELLAAPGVAMALWATLAHFDGPPEVLLQRCRDRIDKEGGDQRPNLLAVAQVFAQLHFNRPGWLDILGGAKVMIESPLIQGIVEERERETRAQSITDVLEGRFTTLPPNIPAGLKQVGGQEGLRRLTRIAGTCASLDAFEEALRAELPAPPAASTRGRRRKKAE